MCKPGKKKKRQILHLSVRSVCFFNLVRKRWPAANSGGVHRAGDHVAGRPAVLSLGVCNGAVFLSEMKPELTLVSEVEVTFFTLQKEHNKKMHCQKWCIKLWHEEPFNHKKIKIKIKTQ